MWSKCVHNSAAPHTGFIVVCNVLCFGGGGGGGKQLIFFLAQRHVTERSEEDAKKEGDRGD